MAHDTTVTPSRYGASTPSVRLPKRPETPVARTARLLGCAERTVKLGVPRALHLIATHVQSIRATRGDEPAVLFLAPLEQSLTPCTEPVNGLAVAEEQADTAESTAQLAYYLDKSRATARAYQTALLRQAIRSERRAASLAAEWSLS